MIVSLTVVAGAAFVWLGMVLGISFLEAPLKFRAPGITPRLGLGIGRIVFTALNRVELVLAAVVAVALLVGPVSTTVLVVAVALAVVLGVQLAGVRPVLNRRSDRVLAGEDPPRSRVHLVYIALEVVKVVLLAALGVLTVSA
jgi:hypothetical protein